MFKEKSRTNNIIKILAKMVNISIPLTTLLVPIITIFPLIKKYKPFRIIKEKLKEIKEVGKVEIYELDI